MTDYIELMAQFGHAPSWVVPSGIRDQITAGKPHRFHAALYERTIQAAPGHRGSPWLELIGLTADLDADLAVVAGNRQLSTSGKARRILCCKVRNSGDALLKNIETAARAPEPAPRLRGDLD